MVMLRNMKMWHLLKTELSYHKFEIMVFTSLGLVGMIANIVTGWRNIEVDLPGVRSLMAVGIMVACFVRLISYTKEKKDRYHTSLPLPLRRIGFSRLLYIISIWICFVILFWISSSTIRPYLIDKIILETLTMSGFILMANATLFIYRDLFQTSSGSVRKLDFQIFRAIMILLGYILFYIIFAVGIPYFSFLRRINLFKENFHNVASSPYAAIVFNLLGIGLTIMSVILFARRKSYLE